jgi:hypothetical protein
MCLCWSSTTKINYGKWLTQFPFQLKVGQVEDLQSVRPILGPRDSGVGRSGDVEWVYLRGVRKQVRHVLKGLHHT